MISTAGIFTAPASGGNDTVTASHSAIQGKASVVVFVNNAPPRVASPAVAISNPNAPMNVGLSVLGSDDGGEANLTYTWTVSCWPTGAPPPTFSVNGSNAAKTTQATFASFGTYTLTVYIAGQGGLFTTSSVTVNVSSPVPIIVSPASSSMQSDIGTNLSVSATDYGSPSSLTYTWTVTAAPAGAAAPSVYNAYPDGATVYVRFHQAGRYTFTATVTKEGGLSASSSVDVNVPQVATTIAVTPSYVELRKGATQPYNASLQDQFGQDMASQPTFTWSSISGSISLGGLYTAPNTYGYDTVTATAGSISQCAAVFVSARPWVVTPAGASPGEVTGHTATLSAVGDQDSGETGITYIWGATAMPRGALYPSFSENYTHDAGTTTVTFYQAGTYTFEVTICGDDAGYALTTSSSVDVTVDQTLTSVSVTPGPLGLGAGQSQSLLATAMDQFGQPLLPQPTLSWAATNGAVTQSGLFTAPVDGSTAAVTASAGSIVGEAMVYPISAVPTVVAPASAGSEPVTGTTALLSVLGADEGGEGNLSYSWTVIATPPGAPAPWFSCNGSNQAKSTTATFASAGDYSFAVTMTDPDGLSATSTVDVDVNATLTTIAVAPAAVDLGPGQTRMFTASAADQFGAVMAVQPTFTWSATAGAVTTSGLFTAPGTYGDVTLTAASGTVVGSTTVTVFDLVLIDPLIHDLVPTLAASGELDRTDMIELLRDVGNEYGQVDQVQIDDLNSILTHSTLFRMPDYVRVLAGDVVDGNPANAHFQGQPLGDLVPGSTAAQMDDLVDKWFLGADHPSVDNGSSITYVSFAGTLFSAGGPSYTDMHQGGVGDCGLIAGFGALAHSSPSAIENMFLDNGDNTWTVRFYDDGVPDYVTVDRFLPVVSDTPVYAGVGGLSSDSNNVLWVALAEKAYAQWNETGKEAFFDVPGYRQMGDGTNSYDGIVGSFSSTLFQQVLGDNSRVRGGVNDLTEQELIDLLASHEAVACSTRVGAQDGLIPGHYYTVVGYDPVSDTFQLCNPWGVNNNAPEPLSFAQLQNYAGWFDIADTTGTSPIDGG